MNQTAQETYQTHLARPGSATAQRLSLSRICLSVIVSVLLAATCMLFLTSCGEGTQADVSEGSSSGELETAEYSGTIDDFESGLTVYDEDDITVCIVAAMKDDTGTGEAAADEEGEDSGEDSSQGSFWVFEIENGSDEDVYVDISDVAVNGDAEVDDAICVEVAAGEETDEALSFESGGSDIVDSASGYIEVSAVDTFEYLGFSKFSIG